MYRAGESSSYWELSKFRFRGAYLKRNTELTSSSRIITIFCFGCLTEISFQNFEVWNNLSNAYIKMGQKARAWKVLQEAVKCDYDNWKVGIELGKNLATL